MPESPRIIYVPSYDDYEGGPFSPAFTDRAVCEQYIATIAAAAKEPLDRYEIQEWPLLDAMPARVPYWRRAAQVHWDGFVCPGYDGGGECWDFEGPQPWRGPVAEMGYGADVSVAVTDHSALDGAFEDALREAHAQVLAAKRPAGGRCGPECRHPAVAGV